MRGYASLIAALISFVIIASAAAVIFATTVRNSSVISSAQQFRRFVQEKSGRIAFTILSVDWDKDTNILTVVLRNDGVPVDLNSISLFVDGKYLGSCADINCYEDVVDGHVLVGEQVAIVSHYASAPYRVYISADVRNVAAIFIDENSWRKGCLYRRTVIVNNTSGESYVNAQFYIDLGPDFDYSKTDRNALLITGADGTTALPFWVEYWDVNGYSRIWFRGSVAANDSNVFFLYYGCDSVPSYFPEDVFIHDLANLVAYWPLDGNGEDFSGNGNDLNAYSVVWVPGRKGLAAYFDGSTSSYLIRNPFSGFPSDSVTVVFWMDTNDATKNGTPLSYAAGENPHDNEFLIYNYQDFRIYRATTSYTYRSTGVSANDGNWHMIAVAWEDADGNLLFMRDLDVNFWSGFAAGYPILDGGSLVFGQEQDSVGGGFDSTQAFLGVIDEVLLFSQYLTTNLIADIYHNDYLVSPYYPGHLLVFVPVSGVFVSIREEVAHSYGVSNK